MTKLEKNIGYIMRIGVSIAMLFMLTGTIIIIVKLACNIEMSYPDMIEIDISKLWDNLICFDQWTYLLTGVFFLIFTPILRVMASVVTFAVERDIKYVVITLIVLSIIVFTLVNLIINV